jgi:hypothetical protein
MGNGLVISPLLRAEFRFCVMTSNELLDLLEHETAMVNARLEFDDFWADEQTQGRILKLSRAEKVAVEITAWNAFLVAKGLKK